MKKIKNTILYILSLIIEFILLFYFSKNYANISFPILISIFMVCVFNIAIALLILPIIFWKTIAKKSLKYDKLSKEDFMKNNQLYREILSDISPAILTYIDTMDFDYDAITTSVLLYLKSKKVLTFNKKEILKTNNLDALKLDNIENYILNSISDGKFYISKKELSRHIINEASTKKLIYENNNTEEKVAKKIILLIAIFICIFILTFITMTIFDNFLGFLGILIFATFPIALITYLFTYFSKYNQNPIFRTKKGNDLNRKLEGLKKYIKEYSLLNDKNDSSIEIWKDYLIYSVIFKQNKKITQEYSQYFIIE